MSGTISKIKVGRLWGYPIIVATGKSKHEAILLDCNTDNPQEFLNKKIDVKIRWKVAGYNDTVPARDVTLQDIDAQYYVPRKAATMAAESLSKKRKTTSDAPNSNYNSTNTNSNIDINNAYIDEGDKKPSAVTSSDLNVKEEEIETDSDDDNNEPVSVTSSTNVKEEDVETDDEEEGDKEPQAVTSSGINDVKEEEIETDNDEEKKPSFVTSGIKTEDIETDEEDDETSVGGSAVKTEDDEVDDRNQDSGGVVQEGKDNEEDKGADIVDLTATGDEQSTTLVEFKFCSERYNTYDDQRCSIIDNYEWEGTLHIPMYQNATTGIYTLPVGKTLFRGKVDMEKHKKLDRDDYKEFEGSFVKTEVEPQTDYVRALSREGDDKCYSIEFDLGMNTVEDDNGNIKVHPRENIPGKYTKSTPLTCRGWVFNEWQNNQGGILEAYENGLESCRDLHRGYNRTLPLRGIGLYTVLSVHKPNEESPRPLRVGPEGYKPDWDFLVNAYHARLRERGYALGYAQAAVKEYRYFLALKAEETGQGDTKSAGYSPSIPIDDVWHTHISFLRRYQCDTLYLTDGQRVIEHLPILYEDSFKAYMNAYEAHSEKMNEADKSVDSSFWHNPEEGLHDFGDDEEDSSYAQCG